MTIEVFLADPSAYFRAGLRQLLEARPGIRVTGDAGNEGLWPHALQLQSPDVAVVDAAMAQNPDPDAIWRIHEVCPRTRVIVVSMDATAEHALRAFAMGARGYVLKDCAAPDLPEAVPAVHDGRRYVSRKLAELLTEAVLRRIAPHAPWDQPVELSRSIRPGLPTDSADGPSYAPTMNTGPRGHR